MKLYLAQFKLEPVERAETAESAFTCWTKLEFHAKLVIEKLLRYPVSRVELMLSLDLFVSP